MQQLLAFLKENATPEAPIACVFDDTSRLARSISVHEALRDAINEANGVLFSPTQRFGRDADSRMTEMVQATVAQHFREKNAETTRSRLAARWANGYYTANAPMGYRYEAVKGRRKMLVPDEPVASYIRDAFGGLATGRFASASEVKRYFETKPDFPRNTKGEVRLGSVIEMVRRDTYAGFLTVRTRGIFMQPAQHEALVDVEMWEKANKRLDGRAPAPAKLNVAEDFPLRGHIACACCGGEMTAGWSKGRSKRYGYYVCQQRGCDLRNKGVRKELIEGEFLDIVKQLSPSPGLFAMATDMFKRFWNERIADGDARRAALKRELTALERQTDTIAGRLVSTNVPAAMAAYEQQLGKLEVKKAALRDQTGKALEPLKPFDEMFARAWSFLANPWVLWEKGNYHHKRLLLRMAFTDKLTYLRGDGFADLLNRKIALPFGTYDETTKSFDMVPGEASRSRHRALLLIRFILI